ncbi:SNF2 family N-terminal domain-containing protein [Xylaria telfairii]|nr:SNF2 family N-terminal domain-containing protein [Xylaria telfairii]
MFNHSSQKRALGDGIGTSGSERYGFDTKRPCKHHSIIYQSYLQTYLGLPNRANTSRLQEIYSLGVRNEAQTSQDPESDTICFGMLKDISIRFNHGQDTYSSIADKLGQDDNIFIPLQLEHSEDRCDVLAHGVPFATMGAKIHFALKSLFSAELLSYNGVMPQAELRQELATAAHPSRTISSKLCYKMALIMFGPRSIKHGVAKDLAKYRLFLQHPVPMPEGIVYENPQYLSIVASSFRNGAILPPIPTELFNQGSCRISISDPDESTTIAAVLDNLPRHQKEAVDFLLCRESTEKQAKILWKPENLNSERPMYKHVITGSTSSKPNDTLGGILADGMGLGKTLSMIACIVSSLAYSEEFANSSTKDSQRTAPVASTLVILPSVLLLETWVDEIERHVVPGTLSVYKYHGPNRKLPSSSSLPYHIVLSTYGTVAADYSRGAHVIRNLSTRQFKAVKNLAASIRWCVTGTPMQNSLKDLASLVTFLRVPLLDNLAMFRKHIEGRRENTHAVAKTNYRNLRHLLESICLRRCTLSILPSLGVSFTENRPYLSDVERRGYNELNIWCNQQIKAAVNSGSTGAKNKRIVIAILKLRMFCNTGLLSPMESLLNGIQDEGQFKPDELISLLQQCGEALCTNCQTEVSSSDADAYFEERQHLAGRLLKCQECAQSTSNTQDAENFDETQSLVSGDMMQGIQFEHDHTSASTSNVIRQISYPSKVLSLVEDIKTHCCQDKSIVFSFWRRSLDLVERILVEQHIVFVRVDGTIHPSKRREVLASFQENPSIRVLLMTIGTGAVG